MPYAAIEYYYSVRSSFTYLGAARLNAIAARHGLTINHHPIDLPVVVGALDDFERQRTADRPQAGARIYESSPVRERYTRMEYQRWSRRLDIPINVDPKHHYGARELPSGSVILAQRRGSNADALSHAILQALWRDDRDIASPEIIASLLQSVGIANPGEFVKEALSESVQSEFQKNSQAAVAAGIFGSPSYLFGGELFFGQDRLDFLEEAIVASRAGSDSLT